MALEEKSLELKVKVQHLDSSWFLGDISSLMMHITHAKDIEQLRNLKSPMRQLYYLAALNLTSSEPAQVYTAYSLEEWMEFVALLNEIDSLYDELFLPQEEGIVDEEWVMKRRVAMPTFLSYFNQGPLNYEEQEIQKITDLYTKYNTTIEAELGVSVAEFLEFYEFVDAAHQHNFSEVMSPNVDGPTWEQFVTDMFSKGIMPPDFHKHMPENFKRFFKFLDDGGSISRISKTALIDKFGETKAAQFDEFFVIGRQESDFVFYTQKNPILEKPLFMVSDEELQIFEVKQLIHAIESLLDKFCSNSTAISDSYNHHKGKFLERRVESVLRKLFPKEARFFTEYYVDGNEQDILIIYKSYAFIIEAKGRRGREPLRDPDRAYDRIRNDFNDCISDAYDQAYRVKSKFIDKADFEVRDSNGRLKDTIVTSRTRQAFSILVSSERYGPIQTNLADLLDIFDDDSFPWSVNLDDFEVFILSLLKVKLNHNDFIQFLNLRQNLHGHLLCGDELEICGAFLQKKVTYSQSTKSDLLIVTTPEMAQIFDDLYYKGLGFENEKYLDKKLSGKNLFWG